MLRNGLQQLGLAVAACLVTLLAFDLLAYFFAPASLTSFSLTYRSKPNFSYLKGYFRADPVMGFDIAPSQNRGHRQRVIGAGKVAATSSDLGCRSPQGLREVQAAADYTYFAGDSFTWGYVPADKTFVSVYAHESGKLALNCGVSATGQWHQLEKLRRTASAIGRFPSRVVVGFSPNDPEDDLWHLDRIVVLDTTVSLTEKVRLPAPLGLVRAGKKGEPSWTRRELSHESLVRKVQDENRMREGGTWRERLHGLLARHSLTHELLVHAKARHIYHHARARKLAAQKPHYESDPHTRPHREALKAWRDHARRHGYELLVVFIPELATWEQEDRRRERAEWMAYLDSLGVRHLDFRAAAEDRNLLAHTLYWPRDSHLNEEGNRVLGEWLARELP